MWFGCTTKSRSPQLTQPTPGSDSCFSRQRTASGQYNAHQRLQPWPDHRTGKEEGKVCPISLLCLSNNHVWLLGRRSGHMWHALEVSLRLKVICRTDSVAVLGKRWARFESTSGTSANHTKKPLPPKQIRLVNPPRPLPFSRNTAAQMRMALSANAHEEIYCTSP